jgi:hypothetical protein
MRWSFSTIISLKACVWYSINNVENHPKDSD